MSVFGPAPQHFSPECQTPVCVLCHTRRLHGLQHGPAGEAHERKHRTGWAAQSGGCVAVCALGRRHAGLRERPGWGELNS